MISTQKLHRFILLAFVGFALFFGENSFAVVPTSYRVAHPIGGMHMLPPGEVPGWDNNFWLVYEMSHANIWNAPFTMENLKTGDTLTYTADYEQSYGNLEIGGAITPKIGLSFELPYAYRAGGGLDHMIDAFHLLINSDRYNREFYSTNQMNFSITKNGEEQIVPGSYNEGSGNFKTKLKIWWWKNLGKTKGSCPCGFATSFHVKAPTTTTPSAWTSGTFDYTFMMHLGIPMGSASAFWWTSSVTHLGENILFEDWPRNDWPQMHEMSYDFAIDKNWGFLMQIRMESPLFDGNQLAIVDSTASEKEFILHRMASGWNSLIHWRGSQSLGFRYRSTNSQLNMLFLEDWGPGTYDENGDDTYVTNAPDVGVALQYAFSF
ncbi:MAG: DUF3187 family protein [Pseudobdellovibrionaceae bacterium]|nr:DUF3187 family protein [Bdellovibrionales bacterium]USN46574.1 MAG: DUF3187 family protein [Pseudobdellovibrionaceae bacterium]